MGLQEIIGTDFDTVLNESGASGEILFSSGEIVRAVIGECALSNEYEPGASVEKHTFSATFRRDAISALPQVGSRASIDGKPFRVETVRHAYFSALVVVDFSEI